MEALARLELQHFYEFSVIAPAREQQSSHRQPVYLYHPAVDRGYRCRIFHECTSRLEALHEACRTRGHCGGYPLPRLRDLWDRPGSWPLVLGAPRHWNGYPRRHASSQLEGRLQSASGRDPSLVATLGEDSRLADIQAPPLRLYQPRCRLTIRFHV